MNCGLTSFPSPSPSPSQDHHRGREDPAGAHHDPDPGAPRPSGHQRPGEVTPLAEDMQQKLKPYVDEFQSELESVLRKLLDQAKAITQ